VQSILFSLNGNIFVALLAQRGLDTLKWCMALAAGITNVGVGHDVGDWFAAVVERRQFAGAKSAATCQIDAKHQPHPQNKG
jgi:hypothetical protein